jgi:RNA polymerase sigma-70 factor (ECF subfamily)
MMALATGSPDDSVDRGLLARVAARDRDAFEQLYATYARRVLAFVRDIVVSPELAEEVASDAMIAMWHAARGYRGESRVLTWLLSIAHHKAVDAVRRRGTPSLALDALPEYASNSSSAHHSHTIVEIEDRFVLDLALRALSAEHRTVLQLMYGFGCSQAEIAAIMRCPLATVKTRAFYAKRRLRDELDRAAVAERLA